MPEKILIPPEDLPNMVGSIVHWSKAKHGCQWRLITHDDVIAILETPVTKNRLRVPIAELYYTNRHKHRILHDLH